MLNIRSFFRYTAFILKFTGKQYPQQHFVIVQNNHIAETGFIPVNDGFIQKKDHVEDVNNVKEQLFNQPQQQQRFVIVENNHFAVIKE